MKISGDTQKSRAALYLLFALVFAACLWIGWHDLDLRVPQEIIRENIRSGIRGMIQLAIQYFIPANILVFFLQEIMVRRRAKFVRDQAPEFQ